MYHQHHYAQINNEHIYFSIFTIKDFKELSLYRDNKLVLRKAVDVGQHVLQHRDLSIDLNLGYMSCKTRLTINGNETVFPKIKRANVRAIFKELEYYNDINPKPIPRKPMKIGDFILPTILLLLGVLLFYLVRNSPKYMTLPGIFFACIGFAMVVSPFVALAPAHILPKEAKSKFTFILSFIGAMSVEYVVSILT